MKRHTHYSLPSDNHQRHNYLNHGYHNFVNNHHHGEKMSENIVMMFRYDENNDNW